MMALDFLHLLSAATWVGGLGLLLVFLWQADGRGVASQELQRAGVRFGTLALVAVTVLAFTGVIIAVAVLGAEALTQPGLVLASGYGLLLAGKILLAIAMVALAAVNRYVLLESPTEQGMAGRLQKAARKASGGRVAPVLTAGRLRRTVAVEAILGAVVLLLAAFLTSVPPPSTAAPASEDLLLDGEGSDHFVHAEMKPPRVGEAAVLHLTITPKDPADPPVTTNTCGRDSCIKVLLQYGDGAPEAHVAHPMGTMWMVHDAVWAQVGPATATVVISTGSYFEDEVELRFTVAE
jgi:uncharacterized membrane protein